MAILNISSFQPGVYLPWIWAAVFAVLMIASRLKTNQFLSASDQTVPNWISALYLLGFIGLVFTFMWSISVIGWWACLPVMGLYGLTTLIQSVVTPAMANLTSEEAKDSAAENTESDSDDIPEGFVEFKTDFTDEETAAIAANMKAYEETLPKGTRLAVPDKVIDSMTAQALEEYADELLEGLGHLSKKQAQIQMTKAAKSCMKAYGIHNLPAYLFRVASVLELIGNDAKAKTFFKFFLTEQAKFKPDLIDTMILEQAGFPDTSTLVEQAEAKIK